MQRQSSGYTILEVMIFLAISTLLLIAAINLVSGRQSQVDFDQTVRNTTSKLQDWINDTATGFTGGDPASMNCKLNGLRPQINSGSPSPTPECIFLGKAIQFTDNKESTSYSHTIYTYSIFGSRLDSDGELATDLVDANPIAATGQGNSGSTDLTDSLNLGTTYVKNVTSSAIIPTVPSATKSPDKDSHLVGFFNSFNTENSSVQNGAEDLNSYLFEYDGTNPTPADQPGGTTLRNCMELISAQCKTPSKYTDSEWPARLESLQVCLSDNRHTALITITSVDGTGASVTYNYQSC